MDKIAGCKIDRPKSKNIVFRWCRCFGWINISAARMEYTVSTRTAFTAERWFSHYVWALSAGILTEVSALSGCYGYAHVFTWRIWRRKASSRLLWLKISIACMKEIAGSSKKVVNCGGADEITVWCQRFYDLDGFWLWTIQFLTVLTVEGIVKPDNDSYERRTSRYGGFQQALKLSSSGPADNWGGTSLSRLSCSESLIPVLFRKASGRQQDQHPSEQSKGGPCYWRKNRRNCFLSGTLNNTWK